MKLSRFIPVLAALATVPAWSHAEVTDGVKAIVNNKAITYEEVENYAHDAAKALGRQYASQPDVFKRKLNELMLDALEQLVEQQLILHSFDTDGYKLPDGVVDELIQERLREQFYGDRATMMKTLQADGVTFEQFRQQLRDQYIVTAMRNQNVQREIIISPAKILDYYQGHQGDYKVEDQVKLRMIVLNKGSASDTNAPELAKEIKAKIKDGAAFADMAGIYSQGSQQHQGGDWGWVEHSVLRPELASTAFGLAVGQVSDPIETPDAVYLMLVEDKRGSHAKPLVDVRADIEKTLRTEQQAHLQEQWINGLKKKTFIRYIEE